MRTSLYYLFLLTGSMAIAQSPHLHPCGTSCGKDEWYQEFTSRRQHIDYRGGNSAEIATTLHLVGTDNGSGYFNLNELFDGFCRLNDNYQNTGIQFFIQWPLRYINNTAFAQHDSINHGAAFMLQYKVPGTMNSFIVPSAAGNCGYNMKYAGNIMAQSCMDGNTWGHEVGHYFNVQHPFYGWEKQTYNYNVPTPLTVRADYTHFMAGISPPGVVEWDTVDVEKMDRSNCATAADGICDTWPDYISTRWPCNATDSMGMVLQKDPNGVDFHSDGRLIMSYSYDECNHPHGFSQGQANLMHAYINDHRQDHLRSAAALNTPITAAPSVISPVIGQVAAQGQQFTWNRVPNATHYIFEIWRGPSSNPYSLKVMDILTTDTFALAPYMVPIPSGVNQRYLVRLKGINQGYTCGPKNDTYVFNPQLSININEVDNEGQLTAYPNPIPRGEALVVESEKSLDLVQVYNQLGQLMITIKPTQMPVMLETKELASGIYYLVGYKGENRLMRKIVVE